MTKNTKINIVLITAYLILIGLLVFNIIQLKDVYSSDTNYYTDEINAAKIENIINGAIETEEDERRLVRTMDDAVNEYYFDIVMLLDGNLLYSTIPYYEGDTLEPRVNHLQITTSFSGDYDFNDNELEVFYSIYKISDSSVVNVFIKYIFFISLITILLFCFTIYLVSIRMILPIRNIRKSIAFANDYNFDEIVDKGDSLNQSFKGFVSDLQSDLSTVSKQHTELEKRLLAKRLHLRNILIVSRSMVHDLKTPIHRNILENEAKAKEFSSNQELVDLADLNQSLNHVIMQDINRILGVLKNNNFTMKVEVKDVDVIATLQRSLVSLNRNMLNKELTLNLDVPEELMIRAEETTFILLINNLLSNMILYAKDNSEVKIYADKTDTTVTLSFYNEASYQDIATMLNTETLFNEVRHQDSGNYIYKSGNGLFLIKDLAKMLDAEYILETTEESVYIKIVFNY